MDAGLGRFKDCPGFFTPLLKLFEEEYKEGGETEDT